ncbi:type II secretion system protein GspN [Hyalangium sp.]|uniref:type II secretion system protein GspN n=1 Tax=Hyalangium sp. TaxID=2028555 RepID=UPI002D613140|nr:type II secretion system protein GspN [Hyalangium sp.]HYH95214.1 type II secretion system protein GspN [Hyalangium sp.]
MATETKTARWKIVLGYSAFSLFALVLCFFLTFPYSTLRARVATEALKMGYVVRIDTLRPGFFGLAARGVRISQPPAPLSSETIAALTSGDPSTARMLGPAELGEAVTIDALSLRPTLFPLGAAFQADAMGGQISGNIGGRKDLQVRVKLDKLDPAQGNLKNFSGLDLEGSLNGSLTLSLPAAPGAAGRPGEPDLSQADGELVLDGQNLLLKGSVEGSGVASKGSPVALLFPGGLPRIPVGELTAQIRFEKGQGTVDKLRLGGDQLEILGTGTLKLGKRIQYIEPAMDVKIRVEPELVKSLGTAGLGLSILPPDKEDPKFRSGRLSGSLGKLSFLGKR